MHSVCRSSKRALDAQHAQRVATVTDGTRVVSAEVDTAVVALWLDILGEAYNARERKHVVHSARGRN